MNDCRFFVPGPTWVRPEILEEMTRPMIGHRSAEFKDLFRKIIADLKPLFVTTQDTFVATCSGTGLMEASLANCATRRVLITTCGAFSDRWAAIAESLGLEVDRLETPWGTAVDPDALADQVLCHFLRAFNLTSTSEPSRECADTLKHLGLCLVVQSLKHRSRSYALP